MKGIEPPIMISKTTALPLGYISKTATFEWSTPLKYSTKKPNNKKPKKKKTKIQPLTPLIEKCITQGNKIAISKSKIK